jgi:imidazolonepropionase-like amidohydrolase
MLNGPRVVASGPIVTAIGGLGDPYSAWVSNRNSSAVPIGGVDDILRAVRQQIKADVDHIKLGTSGTEASPFTNSRLPKLRDEEMAAAASGAHRQRRTVRAHAQATGSIKDALPAGVNSIKHGSLLDEEDLELFNTNGASLVPTLSTIYSFLELGLSTGTIRGCGRDPREGATLVGDSADVSGGRREDRRGPRFR